VGASAPPTLAHTWQCHTSVLYCLYQV